MNEDRQMLAIERPELFYGEPARCKLRGVCKELAVGVIDVGYGAQAFCERHLGEHISYGIEEAIRERIVRDHQPLKVSA